MDYLQLAVTEIRTYGTHSVQVCRRLRSLLNGLLVVAAPDRREAIHTELSLLDDSITRGFPDAANQAIARASDLGASAHRPWSGRTRTVGDASKWPTPVQGRAD